MNNILQLIQISLLIFIVLLIIKNKTSIKLRRTSGDKKLILDSCALIDGRILDIVNAGFIQAKLIIPKFILGELQILADGQDAHKRERARFGLDIVQALQSSSLCEVTVYSGRHDTSKPTDDNLVLTAKKLSADLCTIDYNLNKVASIEGINVLNINELANAIRPVALPGEVKQIKIVQKGSNKDQGVGYLEDGSMVVVEAASQNIGETLNIEVSRYIQTDAGKMLFARKAGKRISSKARSARNKKNG